MTEFSIPWQQPETMPANTELLDESPFQPAQFGAVTAAGFVTIPEASGMISQEPAEGSGQVPTVRAGGSSADLSSYSPSTSSYGESETTTTSEVDPAWGVGEQWLAQVIDPIDLVKHGPRRGDLLVRRTPAGWVDYLGVIVGNYVATANAFVARGIAVEAAGPGLYVEVAEVPLGGTAVQFTARRIDDPWSHHPRGQTIYRPGWGRPAPSHGHGGPQFGRSAEIAQPSVENLAKQVAPGSDAVPYAGKPIYTDVALSAAAKRITAVVSRISELVKASGLPQFVWNNGSMAPIGYLEGMARTYARVYCNFKKNPRDPLADKMARGVAPGAPQLDNHGNYLDAVAKFAQNFNTFGADISIDGVHVLRAVFTILFSVGMREGNGKHCTGWDRGKLTGWGDPSQAQTPTAANSEAGLFQVSFDIGVGVPGDFQDLYTRYKKNPLSGFLEVFSKGVTCNAADWQNFGAPAEEGFKFQKFSKECPAFTAELAALGIRVRANHWGPINNNHVEIVRSAWDLLLEIEKAMDELDGCIAVAM